MDRAEITDGRTTAVGKLLQVQFAEEHRPGSFQPANNLGVLRRNAILEYAARRGGSHAGRVDEVLQCNRHPVQRTFPVAPLNLPFSCARLRKCGISCYRNESVQLAVQPLYTTKTCLRQLH